MTAKFILNELKSIASPEKASILSRFFKTGRGQYGEGDVFLGITVPRSRNVAKANRNTPLPELEKLLASEFHEARFCALAILTERFRKAKEAAERREIYDFYFANIRYINNWDLVDLTCPNIVGTYLLDKDRSILYEMSESKNLWEQRIAIVSTFAFIRSHDLTDTFAISEKLLYHKHDLIHKAIGWMLREAGKRDKEQLIAFLDEHATGMPRTALRYAIEKFPEAERQYYLRRDISVN